MTAEERERRRRFIELECGANADAGNLASLLDVMLAGLFAFRDAPPAVAEEMKAARLAKG